MTANKAKLILNPATLRPAMRVDRPKDAPYPRLGCDAPHAGVYVSAETRAYWRGFADGAREAQAAFDKQELASLSAMAASYTTKTRGF